MNDFDKWLKSENEKEKKLECLSRHCECDGCPYEEDCKHIDVNGNYKPSNCRWVNMKTQCQNRRKWGTQTHNRPLITWNYKGETHTIAEWSEITGIDGKILRSRKHDGWDMERILTTPPMDYDLTLKKGRCL